VVAAAGGLLVMSFRAVLRLPRAGGRLPPPLALVKSPCAAATPGAADASGDAAAAAAAAGDVAAAAGGLMAPGGGDPSSWWTRALFSRFLSGKEAIGIVAGFEAIGHDTWNTAVVVFPVLLLTVNALPRS